MGSVHRSTLQYLERGVNNPQVLMYYWRGLWRLAIETAKGKAVIYSHTDKDKVKSAFKQVDAWELMYE